ncbi:hypothetical protein [Glaciibacter superstes]|uniref:hypothetical protein n=1 Tax=Glaciibacter superstes TaxID=501023 RepID=UPI00040201D2|nr:hypothetical protein [Glaciibacter superstes]
MGRAFALAGLLRLRQLQKDQAASELAQALARASENSARRSGVRRALGGTPTEATSTEAIYAIAAARASARSMISDLDSLGRRHEANAHDAQLAFSAALRTSRALEKLEDRHSAAVVNEDLHAEQIVLDEIASTAWHRERKGTPQ